jgi:mono/diheme cytochrome c family protein
MLITGSLACLMACSGSSTSEEGSTESQNTDQAAPAEEATMSAELTQKMETGKTVYNSYCIACHQSDGSGVPGAFPPLKETDWVNGEKDTLISIVLNGLQGPIEVNGEPYNNVMTPHNFLSDEEIAGVLTYVRNSFGNSSSEVTAEEVAAIRK